MPGLTDGDTAVFLCLVCMTLGALFGQALFGLGR